MRAWYWWSLNVVAAKWARMGERAEAWTGCRLRVAVLRKNPRPRPRLVSKEEE